MRASDPDIRAANLAARQALCLLHCDGDTIDHLADVDDHTLAQPPGRAYAHAEDVHLSVAAHLADHGADFGGANIETDYGWFDTCQSRTPFLRLHHRRRTRTPLVI